MTANKKLVYVKVKNDPVSIAAIKHLGKYSQNKSLLEETIKMFKFLGIHACK